MILVNTIIITIAFLFFGNNKTYVFELPFGSVFKLYNGRVFKKGNKRVKRIECIEINSGKLYLFNPNAEVELIEEEQLKIGD